MIVASRSSGVAGWVDVVVVVGVFLVVFVPAALLRWRRGRRLNRRVVLPYLGAIAMALASASAAIALGASGRPVWAVTVFAIAALVGAIGAVMAARSL